MVPPIVYAVGQARLAEAHEQAQRDALARAVRRAHRNQHGHRAPGLLTVVARRTLRGASDLRTRWS